MMILMIREYYNLMFLNKKLSLNKLLMKVIMIFSLLLSIQ